MISDVFIADNGGQRTVPGTANYKKDPNADTQRLTNASKDTDTEATVVGGKRYLLVPIVTGGFYAGLATVATAANVEWVCALYHPGVVINIPLGHTTLHYATDTNNGIAYLIPLE